MPLISHQKKDRGRRVVGFERGLVGVALSFVTLVACHVDTDLDCGPCKYVCSPGSFGERCDPLMATVEPLEVSVVYPQSVLTIRVGQVVRLRALVERYCSVLAGEGTYRVQVWRPSDPGVASVIPTSPAEAQLVGLRPGRTTVSAVIRPSWGDCQIEAHLGEFLLGDSGASIRSIDVVP